MVRPPAAHDVRTPSQGSFMADASTDPAPGAGPAPSPRPHRLAVITGASSGIGYELATLAARHRFDLVLAADEPAVHESAETFRKRGVHVTAVEVDLGTREGVADLHDAVQATGRPVDALFANAGITLGHAFLDQRFEDARRVVDINVIGTLDIVHRIGRAMRERGEGRILITGSIAGQTPGPFMALYNGSKALLNSFAAALREELAGSGVSVTCLQPGATRTPIFAKAGMSDTLIAKLPMSDPKDVVQDGFDALMRGDAIIVSGMANKVLAAGSNITPSSILAKVHRQLTKPGSGEG